MMEPIFALCYTNRIDIHVVVIMIPAFMCLLTYECKQHRSSDQRKESPLK